MRGGKREGAGKPKGYKAPHTLEAQEMKKALILKYHEHAEEVNSALIAKAIEGDIPAIKELHDRVWGKAPQALEMSGKDGEPLFTRATPEMIALAKEYEASLKKVI